MVDLRFEICNRDSTVQSEEFRFAHTCLFGWVGRDRKKIAEHIAELEAQGIRGPKEIPEHFIVAPFVNTQQREIVCIGDKTCGEIELFFFVNGQEVYFGLGSDHTDRELETVDMVKSKGICQKPMSAQIWRYRDVKDHWDSLRLTAWQTDEQGSEVLYQDSYLSEILALDDLLVEAKKLYSDLDQVLIWSGTIPTKNGLMYGSSFRGRLEDEVLGRSLSIQYQVKVVPADV